MAVGQSLFASAWPVVRFTEIDSTSEEARRRFVAGEAGPVWFLADSQTAGRGRLGREWRSPPGNLFATALFPIDRPLTEAAFACFAAGLAVIDAAGDAGADKTLLSLKWPNDVLIGEAKLAGVLIESLSAGPSVVLAAGFGVNLAVAPEAVGRETAALTAATGGAACEPARFLSFLDAAFRARLAQLWETGFAATRADWIDRAAHMGQMVQAAAGQVSGRMIGIDLDGALELQTAAGDIQRVRAGEVSLVSHG